MAGKKREVIKGDYDTLEQLLAGVQRKYGTKALSLASDAEELYRVQFLPSGIEELDTLLGGGFPQGHITELFGPPGSGKSYITLKTIGQTIADGGAAALVNTDASFPLEFAKSLGVRLDGLLISTPESGEEALDLCVELIHRKINLVVLDSATALVSKDDLGKATQISGYSPEVRLWNAGLKRIKPALALTDTAFLFTNEVRANVGVFYGPTTTEPMGYRSRHASVLRLEVRRKEWIKKGDQRVGHVTLLKVAKAKYDGCKPYAEATIDILTSNGN